MTTKFKAGTKLECYDDITIFKGTIRGTGTVTWSADDGFIQPDNVYLIEGIWDKEKNIEWFEVRAKCLDNVDDADIIIINN